jgi:hypothetical protein
MPLSFSFGKFICKRVYINKQLLGYSVEHDRWDGFKWPRQTIIYIVYLNCYIRIITQQWVCNVCKPAVYLYTNARGRVIYVSVLFHATLCMIFVANIKYI